jgi:hypothetical protein
MSRRRSIIGVLTVIALCMGAIGVTNAFAEQTGYTLHECVAKGSGGTGVIYTANCAEKSTGGTAETKPIVTTEPVEVAATSTSNFILKATIAGINFEITCSGGTGTALEAMPKVKNVLTGEFHHVTDEGATTFTGCKVTAPAGKGCVVANVGGAKETLTTVNLKSDTTASGSTKFEPVSGTTFIEIEVSGCTTSALNGTKTVTGSATSARESATTQAFTTTSGSALLFAGQNATFTGKYHLATTTGGSGTILSLEKAGE